MPRVDITPTLLGVLLCSVLILLGPLYTADGYNVVAHTSSQLGAQNTPFAWLMNLGFIALGVGVGIDARRIWWIVPFVSVIFLMFAAAMAMTGVFSLQPIDPALPYNDMWHVLHSVFAMAAGICFCVGAIGYGMFRRAGAAKWISIGAGMAATGLSVAIFSLPELQGLLQRLMFAVTFTWLAVYLPHAKPPPRHQS